MILKLDGLALDDNDLKHIRDAAAAQAMSGNLSIQTFAGIQHELNIYGVENNLRWGSNVTFTKEGISL